VQQHIVASAGAAGADLPPGGAWGQKCTLPLAPAPAGSAPAPAGSARVISMMAPAARWLLRRCPLHS
jgi:hypothetical protein